MMRTPRYWLLCAALLAACESDPSAAPGPASIVVTPDSVDLLVGASASLTATVRDRDGNVLSGQAIAWTTSSSVVAAVTSTGTVTAASAGRAVITAAVANRRDSAMVNVTAPANLDYDLVDAQFTQSVQVADGSIPMVLGGNGAVLNVLIRSSLPGTTDPQVPVVLRLFNANGTLIRADTVRSNRISDTPTYAAPAAQFLVPATLLTAGMLWQAEIDPRHTLPEANRSNNIFPRTGRSLLATTSVPPLRVRFVPIFLAAHNGSVTVSQSQMPEYLRVVRSVHPLGSVSTSIGTTFSTSASFGTPPSGGQAAFWQQVLSELDLARVTDTSDPQAHWFGLLRPPTGFTFTAFGGFGYIPGSGTTTGSGTRTALAVAIGWFNNSSQSRELVAHELGHNFGRRHAPCGSPANPDPLFPQSNGTIGIIAHDVFAWSSGTASSAIPIDPGTGDVMGYCLPTWASEYTYRGVLSFRGPGTATAVARASAPTDRKDVLIVRGVITRGQDIRLEPVFTLQGHATRPERTGGYRLEGRSADGRVLFAHDFAPAELDHAPDLQPFTFALELSAADRAALATIEVRGPTSAARIEQPAPAALRTLTTRAPNVRRMGESVLATCAGNASGIALLDEEGQVLATARGASLRATVAPQARVAIACSVGLQTTRSALITP